MQQNTKHLLTKKQIQSVFAAHEYIFGKEQSFTSSFLGQGENNCNYLVIWNKKKYVLRISLLEGMEKNMRRETKVLRELPPGFGPCVFVEEYTKKLIPFGYRVQSYVEGKPLKRWRKEHLKIHAQQLARLHKKRYTTQEEVKGQFSIYTRFLSLLRQYKEEPFLLDPAITKIIVAAKAYFKQKDTIFKQVKKFSRIHRDLGRDNILYNKRTFEYIDWEWSIVGDNAIDLAKLYSTRKPWLTWRLLLPKEKEDYFIKSYLTAISFADSNLKERIHVWQIYNKLSDLFYISWKVTHWQKQKCCREKTLYAKAAQEMQHTLENILLEKGR